jgi:ubiquinone/menaquinone biosynthesis C-methylase UbiE
LNATFDITAASFDRHRALPTGVPEAIRTAIWKTTGKQPPATVLDLGAGTGRIGKAFVEANDVYAGVDSSLEMLREFRAHSPAACLAQADGRRLPFCEGAFDVVMLMQVLSGAGDWRGLLQEAVRVLAPGGVIVVGHTLGPEEGLDARLKRQLAAILQNLGITMHDSGRARWQSLAWLESHALRRSHVVAASWTAERTPQQFFVRHRSGARFAALPSDVQEKALQRLRAWTEETFDAVDKVFLEEHRFELDVFKF